MIYEGNKLWLFASWLVEQGVSEYTVKDALRRNRSGKISSWKHRPHPDDKRIKLIDYDSLPESTRAKLPAKAELMSQAQAERTEDKLNQLEEACLTLQELHAQNCLISDYHFFLKQTTSAPKAEDLKQAAGWLRLLNKYRTPSQTRTINFNTKAELREAVVNQLLANFRQRKAHLYGCI